MEQGLNHTKIQETNGHWMHKLILKFRMLLQNWSEHCDDSS